MTVINNMYGNEWHEWHVFKIYIENCSHDVGTFATTEDFFFFFNIVANANPTCTV